MGQSVTTEKLKDMDYDEAKDFIIANRVYYYGSTHRITYLIRGKYGDKMPDYRVDRLKVDVNYNNKITSINGVG